MKTALVYSFNSQHTSKVAEMLKEHLKVKVSVINIETAGFDELLKHDLLIMGVSTWFDGELPNYWDEILPGLEDQDYSGKQIAIFGLGNQKEYPENYQDAMGILADFFGNRGAQIIGFTKTDGYEFESSAAVKDGKFCGLAIDNCHNEKQKKQMIQDWVAEIFNTKKTKK